MLNQDRNLIFITILILFIMIILCLYTNAHPKAIIIVFVIIVCLILANSINDYSVFTQAFDLGVYCFVITFFVALFFILILLNTPIEQK